MWDGNQGHKPICRKVCMQTIEKLIKLKDPRDHLQKSKTKFNVLKL